MGRLISFALMLIVGILVYNYFFGDDTEKEQSKKVFQITKDLGQQIKDVIKSEKESYDEGKYQGIVNRIKNVLGGNDELSDKYSSQLKEIEDVQGELEDLKVEKETDGTNYDENKEDELKLKLKQLLEELSEDLEK